MESIDLIAILSVAFLGSIGHCSGMCGGFVVGYTAAKIDASMSRLSQFFAHLLYNLGRVATYAVLGGVFGFLGAMLAFERHSQGVLYGVIGLVMVLMGASVLGYSRFMIWLESVGSLNSRLQGLFRKVLHSKSYTSFFGLGLLNGLLPCGFVYFFAVTAASTASVLDGALVMAVFGLATIPVLLAMGLVVGLFQRPGLRKIMNKLAGIVIGAYGFYMLYKGYLFLFTEAPSCH